MKVIITVIDDKELEWKLGADSHTNPGEKFDKAVEILFTHVKHKIAELRAQQC